MIRNMVHKIPIGMKSAIIYTLATVFSKGLAIITVPIFTRLMTTEQIGTVNLYNSWCSLISVVVTLSLTSGGYSAAMKEFEGERDEYQSSVLTLTSLMALGTTMIYLANSAFWNEITGLPTSLMLLMLIGFCFLPAQEFWLARQRYEYKYKMAGLLTIGTATVASVLSVIVVVRLNALDIKEVAIGRLFTNNFVIYGVAFVLWVFMLARGKTFCNKKYWKYSLGLSLPLVGYSLASQVLNVSDRVMINKMVGNSEVGIYGILYTVSSISLMVWSAINSSFVPYLYQNIEKKDNKIKPLSFILLGAYALVAIVLTFLAPEIVKLLATEEYYEAIYIMPPIAAGVFLTSVSNMYSNILIFYKKTKYIMYASVMAATSNVLLNYFLIPLFGYMVAAYTTLFSYVLLVVIQARWAIKVQRDTRKASTSVYNDRQIFLLAFLTVLIALSGLLWYKNTIVRYILSVVVIMLGIIGVIKFKKNNQK